ncbi:MAG: imidazolonepropionase [Bacteroidetes bacterium]|nr:imidazolonepropionase [Bacteroidota bacterium]MBU1113863.1 imidazolonepropionase [Bacteroidota bacterium]MBU1798111.1 imidazolonepropionase [Bacteroidota bacterium]
MITLLRNPTQIITVNTKGTNFKHGKEMNDIGVLLNHSILIEDGIIKNIIENSRINESEFHNEINLENKIVLPGLIECHTHTAFAGSRSEEFKLKLQGISYEDIAKSGGGITKTMNAVRNSTFDELMEIVKPRIDDFISQGITTLEIKSGYGLSFYDEIKLLQVIKALNKIYKIDIIPTFLGAHTFPPEYINDNEKYIDLINNELIPYIANHNLAKFCDAFCESTAFSAEQIERIFNVAKKNGLKLKLHTEQFNSIGGLEIALKMGATSVDHLEVLREEQIDLIAESNTTAVLLPGVSFFLNYDYAPARKLIDSNTIVALATDYNPGSSHISNFQLIMSLAAIKMQMTIEEIISAITINSAKALDISNSVGSLEIGKNADFSVFKANDYSEIVYNVGKNLNVMTIKNGEVIYEV